MQIKLSFHLMLLLPFGSSLGKKKCCKGCDWIKGIEIKPPEKPKEPGKKPAPEKPKEPEKPKAPEKTKEPEKPEAPEKPKEPEKF